MNRQSHAAARARDVESLVLAARESDRDAGSLWVALALLLGAFLVAISLPAHAGLYKWTDERGVVHYSDQMPPDVVNRASFQLNRQGITVGKTEQAKPVTRVVKDESEEQRARLAERERLIAQRRDKALIESYSNEREIELAKTRAVATIEGQVESAQSFVAQMQKRRDELESQKVTFAPRPVPGTIDREIETIDGEVARQKDFIAGKRKESATVGARYDADRQRFRELRGEPTGSVVTTGDGRVVATSQAGSAL
jgi:hypothetical protein